jgi:microtubule-associated protein-like 6
MRDGSLRVYEATLDEPFWVFKYHHICQHGTAKAEWIEDLKFSPDGSKLVVSSHNNRMFLWDVPDFSKAPRVFGQSTSFITHLDWSLDSGSIRTNDGSYELLYYDVKSLK